MTPAQRALVAFILFVLLYVGVVVWAVASSGATPTCPRPLKLTYVHDSQTGETWTYCGKGGRHLNSP